MTGLPRQLTVLALAAARAIIRLMSVLIGLLGQHDAVGLASGLVLLVIIGVVVRYTAVVLAVALVLTLLASSPIWRAGARATQGPCSVSASQQPQSQQPQSQQPQSQQSQGRGTGCIVTSNLTHHLQSATRQPAARPS
ncbi:MAG TPA: hypothetical protein VLW50_03165 [Streptosporangiaceae bacterium]|nr:hypothetical protein [Streptosporangiaceae bacterium]